MPLPPLPAKAAYITLNNAAKRNALSLAILRSLHAQLSSALTGPSGEVHVLPAFRPEILDELEAHAPQHAWLYDADVYAAAKLPSALVLRSEGPVFSSGHDLKEMATITRDEVKETFALCADVMRLIRHSPIPVICGVQGLATAAGLQLALTADYTIAGASTPLKLPGATIGLPCASPATAVSRRVGNAATYRMLLTADTVHAREFRHAIDVVDPPAEAVASGLPDVVADAEAAAFEARVKDVVERVVAFPGQPTAMGKWAFWTQAGLRGDAPGEGGGDGYDEAVGWAGRIMAFLARQADAREGMQAFLEKRKPEWKT
ncbi:Enoyl-CoA hydratase domain-containing protein 3, mitochondrial [Vanrija pseudolonga]|uniref:Enoyl-CoA hydratase domain-containing protein 3, mitochondrial n=1 Tax=Vanrija pseudolonga TaxID=143232 RepID=A0AAF0YGQ8_9TREE|nr:Enoyl-CoA hydratase domain-containing protein 3, mitochondrial [Vanrija pseudolonga]